MRKEFIYYNVLYYIMTEKLSTDQMDFRALYFATQQKVTSLKNYLATLKTEEKIIQEKIENPVYSLKKGITQNEAISINMGKLTQIKNSIMNIEKILK